MVFDKVVFDGNPGELIWKSYVNVLSSKARIYSRKDCDVVFLRNGAFLGAFNDREEYYTFDSNDLEHQSLFQQLFNGKKNSQNCEIYYINRLVQTENKWGTSNRIDIYDKEYDIFTSVGAHGTYRFSISNSLKLFSKVQGFKSGLHQDDLKEFFKNELNMEIRHIISNFFATHQLGIKDLALVTTLEKKVSEMIFSQVKELFEKYGVHLDKFIISQFMMEESFIQKINQIKKDAILNNLKQDVDFKERTKGTEFSLNQESMIFEKQKPMREEDVEKFNRKSEHELKLKDIEKSIELGKSESKNEVDVNSLEFKLNNIKKLYEKNVITKEEYELKRKQIIESH